jgi:hypothetical protein
MDIFNVLAAASASFVFGAIWYMVLSDPWMTASGVARDADGKPLNSSNPRPCILSAISAIVVAGMMRHVLAASGVTAISLGVIAGFGIGAFLIVPWMMMNNEVAGKPFQLTVIDGGYALIGCSLMGAVLMAF